MKNEHSCPRYIIMIFPILLSTPHRCLSKLNVTKTCLFYVFRELGNLETMEWGIDSGMNLGYLDPMNVSKQKINKKQNKRDMRVFLFTFHISNHLCLISHFVNLLEISYFILHILLYFKSCFVFGIWFGSVWLSSFGTLQPTKQMTFNGTVRK